MFPILSVTKSLKCICAILFMINRRKTLRHIFAKADVSLCGGILKLQPSQQTNLAQIWHASGTAGIHPALAYSMWAKHGPGLAEVVPGLRRHTRHGPDVKCSIWPRCQK